MSEWWLGQNRGGLKIYPAAPVCPVFDDGMGYVRQPTTAPIGWGYQLWVRDQAVPERCDWLKVYPWGTNWIATYPVNWSCANWIAPGVDTRIVFRNITGYITPPSLSFNMPASPDGIDIPFFYGDLNDDYVSTGTAIVCLLGISQF